LSYVLLTAAHNEEAQIGATVRSVLNQTQLPESWIIVSDNSCDRTLEVVENEIKGSNFIEIITKNDSSPKANFASKVMALRIGYERLHGEVFDYIGILDADVEVENSYYEKVLREFKKDPNLGIAGGFIHEVNDGKYEKRPFNSVRSVAGGIQMLRHECYDEIGGFIPFSNGGEDWAAEVMARMKGWKVQSFPEIRAYHNRKGRNKRGFLKECYGQGQRAYAIGSHPVFEIFKFINRLKDRPYFLTSCIRLFGYTKCCLSREKRMVSREFVEFLRSEQKKRIKKPIHYRSD